MTSTGFGIAIGGSPAELTALVDESTRAYVRTEVQDILEGLHADLVEAARARRKIKVIHRVEVDDGETPDATTGAVFAGLLETCKDEGYTALFVLRDDDFVDQEAQALQDAGVAQVTGAEVQGATATGVDSETGAPGETDVAGSGLPDEEEDEDEDDTGSRWYGVIVVWHSLLTETPLKCYKSKRHTWLPVELPDWVRPLPDAPVVPDEAVGAGTPSE
jgi:hypothetical protein